VATIATPKAAKRNPEGWEWKSSLASRPAGAPPRVSHSPRATKTTIDPDLDQGEEVCTQAPSFNPK